MQSEQLADIVEQLTSEPEEEFTLQQVVEQAVANIPGCHSCSVFVRRHGTVEPGATTDEEAARVDHLQLELDEGPCLSVLDGDEVVSMLVKVNDTEYEERWPRWGPAAREIGVRSSLSVRLTVGAPVHASLNMYSHDEDSFDEDAIDHAVIYARLASVAMGQSKEISGLRNALQNRLVIGAAQGILMERYGLSLNRSFEVLRRHSNDSNTKLRDVAQAVVDGIDIRSTVS